VPGVGSDVPSDVPEEPSDMIFDHTGNRSTKSNDYSVYTVADTDKSGICELIEESYFIKDHQRPGTP
jgi:hypothetical protein